jgi:UrcA family protein
MNIRASVISGAALLGLASIAPLMAVAATANASQSVTVLYPDLDITSKAGAEQLYVRLQSATRQVCRARVAYTHSSLESSCYHQVLAQAVRDVKAPEVAEVHARALHGKQYPSRLAGGSSTGNLSK